MNESNKKTAVQAGLMIVLFIMLALLSVRMISQMQPKKKARATATTTASAAAEPGSTPSSTNMPPVPRSGDTNAKGMEISTEDLHLNPSQFKVYELNPPKNPFVQTEAMYKDELAKLPGYPQLKSGDYFEGDQPYLPNLPLINDHEWETITVKKDIKVEPYEINGTSEDGQITTNIRLTPKTPESTQLNWSPETGVPLKALLSPSVNQRYGGILSQPLNIEASKKDQPGFVADALGVPGVDGGRGTGDALVGSEGAGNGDSLHAVGVSRHRGELTALIRHNGKTRIVREGSVLPTHYQVLTIKENGVVVIDLRDGSSNWLPLGAAPVESADAKKAKRT
jgi:hypothetical protein